MSRKFLLLTIGSIVFLFICVIGVFAFISISNGNKSNATNPTPNAQTQRNRGPFGSNFDLANICTTRLNRVSSPRGNFRDGMNGGFSDFQTKIDEVCSDGQVSDSEKTELQNLLDSLPMQQNRNFNFN